MSTGSIETSGRSGFRRPRRTARAVGDVRERHGGRRLATGITIAAAIIILWHLARAVLLAPVFPPGAGPWAAWLAVLVILAVGVVSRILSRAQPLPDLLYAVLLIALAVPVWLDVSASWGLLHLGVTPTAAAATGAVLMPVAAIRGTRISLVVASVIGLVLLVTTLLQTASAGPYTATGISVAASAVLPLVLAVVATRGFRRLVGRELDLSIVQSTVYTPRSAFGMRASEELAQLDFDAETLLDDVGSGRIAIPLPAADAERAGRLAAALRLRLIAGRTDTWLRHAVTESAYLNDRVVVDDPEGSAGLLAQEQRDNLLLALWLLVGELRKGQTRPIEVAVSSPDGDDDGEHHSPAVHLTIEVPGVVGRRLDPATWDAVGSVGSHGVVAGSDSFRIEIECRTDPTVPVSASAAESARPRRS
ncbi:hypothetical protein [Agromyces lapidis]|uniref:Uncharacterized protein n=1 Tax=Agromyces lapidis TaxID=279574 RepID=A0ABV5SUP9_9MICO|nr:hypothetical protein [Agromyces lapidis]